MLFSTFLRMVACGAAFAIIPLHGPICAADPAPSESPTHISGTIANVDGSNQKISIRTRDRVMIFLTVGTQTAITRNGKAVTADALHAGDAVQATCVRTTGEESLATMIDASAALPKHLRRKR